MPIIANAKKALRQTKTRTERNRVVRSQVKTATKKVEVNPSTATLAALYSTLDRSVKRGIIHKNKAARLKAQAAKKVAATPEKQISVKTTKKAVKKSAAKKPATKVTAKKPGTKKITKK